MGVATYDSLAKDAKFRSAPCLVATRKERDALTLQAGRIWARKHGVPLYWWWKRPYRGEDSNEDDDFAAESYSSRCCGTKEFFLKGAPCILKHNIAPSEGYANGTKGTMVNIIYKNGLQLPDGEPGELLKIEPPDYINIMCIMTMVRQSFPEKDSLLKFRTILRGKKSIIGFSPIKLTWPFV